MPSLDGYSLNEEIKKLRAEMYTELSNLRESFREIYQYLDNIDKNQKEQKCQDQANATKSKTQKKKVIASATKASMPKA